MYNKQLEKDNWQVVVNNLPQIESNLPVKILAFGIEPNNDVWLTLLCNLATKYNSQDVVVFCGAENVKIPKEIGDFAFIQQELHSIDVSIVFDEDLLESSPIVVLLKNPDWAKSIQKVVALHTLIYSQKTKQPCILISEVELRSRILEKTSVCFGQHIIKGHKVCGINMSCDVSDMFRDLLYQYSHYIAQFEQGMIPMAIVLSDQECKRINEIKKQAKYFNSITILQPKLNEFPEIKFNKISELKDKNIYIFNVKR